MQGSIINVKLGVLRQHIGKMADYLKTAKRCPKGFICKIKGELSRLRQIIRKQVKNYTSAEDSTPIKINKQYFSEIRGIVAAI